MTTSPGARVLADSISPAGDRLTTLEVTIHRFVLAEINTHRVFSRNSASSRAIPLARTIERVREDPAMPISWPAEQRGMQGGAEVARVTRFLAEDRWRASARRAAAQAEELRKLGVHKSIVNRLLEPWLWHVVIVTSTEWENFFAQRCSPLAQPELRVAAEAMRTALADSTPNLVLYRDWHLPLIDAEDLEICRARGLTEFDPRAISAARCARVSYLTHDGVRDLAEDLALYERLTTAEPPHASPLEHVATPGNGPGNLVGWRQLRHEIFPVEG